MNKLFKDQVVLIAEKTWHGENTTDSTYADFQDRIQAGNLELFTF